MSKGTPVKAPPSPTSMPPRQVIKVQRNEPCPCGSGKKYKNCHLPQGEEWLHQLAYKLEKERRKEALRRSGIPWWKRIFS